MSMIELLIVIYLVWYIVKKRKQDTVSKSSRRQQATAIPNRPKKNAPTGMERRKMCTYEAAYSKGHPERVGSRGDYELVVPVGMSRIRCAYCNAENFVPSGTHEHYHCYFCWEKL